MHFYCASDSIASSVLSRIAWVHVHQKFYLPRENESVFSTELVFACKEIDPAKVMKLFWSLGYPFPIGDDCIDEFVQSIPTPGDVFVALELMKMSIRSM